MSEKVIRNEWYTEGDSDLVAQDMFPCVYHGAYRIHHDFGTICPACVLEGRVQLAAPDVPRPPGERDVAMEQEVSSREQVENEREALRRERIDFAFECGDFDAALRLGANPDAVARARAEMAPSPRPSGPPHDGGIARQRDVGSSPLQQASTGMAVGPSGTGETLGTEDVMGPVPPPIPHRPQEVVHHPRPPERLASGPLPPRLLPEHEQFGVRDLG